MHLEQTEDNKIKCFSLWFKNIDILRSWLPWDDKNINWPDSTFSGVNAVPMFFTTLELSRDLQQETISDKK